MPTMEAMQSHGAVMAQHHSFGGGWGGHMMSTPLAWLLVLVLVVAVAALALTLLRGKRERRKDHSAGDCLDKLFAMGELDKETYDRLKRQMLDD